MRDFNYRRGGRGLYRDSQYSNYDYDRYTQQRPDYGNRNLEYSEDYRYSNPSADYERQEMSGFQNNGRFSMSNMTNLRNKMDIPTRPNFGSAYGRYYEPPSNNYGRQEISVGFPNNRTSSMRNSMTLGGAGIIRRQPSFENYMPKRPGYGRNLETSEDYRCSNSSRSSLGNTFNVNTSVNRDHPDRHYYNPNEPTADVTFSSVTSTTRNETFTNRLNSFQPRHDTQASSGASRYIPPPPAPPPIPLLPRLTNQDMSLFRNIIKNIGNNMTSAPATILSPPFKQSILADRDDRDTSNIPRFSRDNIDEYAPIISSSRKTGETVNTLTEQASHYKTSTMRALSSPKNLTEWTAIHRIPLDSLSSREDSQHDKQLGIVPSSSGLERNTGKQNLKKKNKKKRPSGDRNRDWIPNKRMREEPMQKKFEDRQRDRRSGMGSKLQNDGFERNRDMANLKRANNSPFGGRNTDAVSKKKLREEPKKKKSRRNADDYNDGWDDVRNGSIKFKALFPIQAQKIHALMLQMDTPMEIPKTIVKDLPKESFGNLTKEERLNQEFHRRREELLLISKEKTAKKSEKRRRRRVNKRLFVKNFLGKKEFDQVQE